ncbi:MAG: hypothetical protein OEO23_14575, partial [Gemmatimonadota bacterium]|nr:hypothetical protein [Gemmatimonadota bacterium]
MVHSRSASLDRQATRRLRYVGLTLLLSALNGCGVAVEEPPGTTVAAPELSIPSTWAFSTDTLPVV